MIALDATRIAAYATSIRRFHGASTLQHRTEGPRWYPAAGRIIAAIASRYGLDAASVAASVAALSPRNPWRWNVQDAAALAAFVRNGGELPRCTTFHSNRDRAIAFLTGATDWTGSALKVRSFVANMTGDLFAVTVDVWAMRVATDGARDAVAGIGMYREVEAAYRLVAAELELSPAALQAIVWLVAKDDPRWVDNSKHTRSCKAGTFAWIADMLAA